MNTTKCITGYYIKQHVNREFSQDWDDNFSNFPLLANGNVKSKKENQKSKARLRWQISQTPTKQDKEKENQKQDWDDDKSSNAPSLAELPPKSKVEIVKRTVNFHLTFLLIILTFSPLYKKFSCFSPFSPLDDTTFFVKILILNDDRKVFFFKFICNFKENF